MGPFQTKRIINVGCRDLQGQSPFSLILLGIRHDPVPREKDFHWIISTSTIPIPKLFQRIALGPVRRAGSDRDGSSCRCAAPSSALCSFPQCCLDVWAVSTASPVGHCCPQMTCESEQSVGCGVCLHRELLWIPLPFGARGNQELWAHMSACDS